MAVTWKWKYTPRMEGRQARLVKLLEMQSVRQEMETKVREPDIKYINPALVEDIQIRHPPHTMSRNPISMNIFFNLSNHLSSQCPLTNW